MAQAGAQACSREERAYTFNRAVEAIGEDIPDPIRRLLLGGDALERLIRLGKGGRTGLLRIAQMPEHATADDRGQIDLVGETAAVFFIDQEIDGQGQATPGEHRHQTLLPKGTDEAVERHGRDMRNHRASSTLSPRVSPTAHHGPPRGACDDSARRSAGGS